MYLALARKYRPQTFAEVLGQDAPLRALSNAIQMQRVHHALLFCGARGVGKTSLARIFAKSLNCEKGSTLDPCQVCASCVSITNGTSLDVIEIDAASHTGVDHIRELREQVKYVSESRYKIYIIDEVHMLSNSAFNALLKTLEEPPAHVLFVLATTEPHDIPVTILSRCLRFDFRKMTKSQLVGHLQKILTNEKVEAELPAVELIAECAGGSVRDALSLLDQTIGASGGQLTRDHVESLLGLADRLAVQKLLSHMLNGELDQACQCIYRLDEQGVDYKHLIESVLELLRELLLLVITKKNNPHLSPTEQAFLNDVKDIRDVSILMAMAQILLQTAQELVRSEWPRLVFEMAMIKVSQVKNVLSLTQLMAELKTKSNSATKREPIQTIPNAAAGSMPQVPGNVISANQSTAPALASQQASDWYQLVQWIKKVKPPLGGLLADAFPEEFSSQKIAISFKEASSALPLVEARRPAIEALLQQHFGHKVELVVVQTATSEKKKS